MSYARPSWGFDGSTGRENQKVAGRASMPKFYATGPQGNAKNAFRLVADRWPAATLAWPGTLAELGQAGKITVNV
jgi:hypothetical protein